MKDATDNDGSAIDWIGATTININPNFLSIKKISSMRNYNNRNLLFAINKLSNAENSTLNGISIYTDEELQELKEIIDRIHKFKNSLKENRYKVYKKVQEKINKLKLSEKEE